MAVVVAQYACVVGWVALSGLGWLGRCGCTHRQLVSWNSRAQPLMHRLGMPSWAAFNSHASLSRPVVVPLAPHTWSFPLVKLLFLPTHWWWSTLMWQVPPNPQHFLKQPALPGTPQVLEYADVAGADLLRAYCLAVAVCNLDAVLLEARGALEQLPPHLLAELERLWKLRLAGGEASGGGAAGQQPAGAGGRAAADMAHAAARPRARALEPAGPEGHELGEEAESAPPVRRLGSRLQPGARPTAAPSHLGASLGTLNSGIAVACCCSMCVCIVKAACACALSKHVHAHRESSTCPACSVLLQRSRAHHIPCPGLVCPRRVGRPGA